MEQNKEIVFGADNPLPVTLPKRRRGLWICGAAAAVWIGNGLLVAGLTTDHPKLQINPITHTVTLETDVAMPVDGAGQAGFMIGAALSKGMCESNAAELLGFGWNVVMKAADGSTLLSCWSWR